jgi:hypothetical protein
MIEARGDDGDGRVRFARELPVGLVEELSGSAAVRSVMDAVSGAVGSVLESVIPKGPDLTLRFEDLFPVPKGPDFIGQLGRDAASPFGGLIPKGPDFFFAASRANRQFSFDDYHYEQRWAR